MQDTSWGRKPNYLLYLYGPFKTLLRRHENWIYWYRQLEFSVRILEWTQFDVKTKVREDRIPQAELRKRNCGSAMGIVIQSGNGNKL
jgi:hypothetical protein